MENSKISPKDVVIIGCVDDAIVKEIEQVVKNHEGNILVRLEDKVVEDYCNAQNKEENKPVTVEEFVSNEENRNLAEEKALTLFNIITNNADLKYAEERVFSKAEITKQTTLTHRTLGELLDMLSLFGLIEYVKGNHQFKFIFSKELRENGLYADVLDSVKLLNAHVSRYKGAIDSEEKLAKFKEDITQLIKL